MRSVWSYLDELAQAGVLELAFMGGSLELRRADAAPLCPIARQLRREEGG